jgi:hypothetical protein
MITFDPAVSVQPLASVKQGSLVRWGENGEHRGFAVRAINDPNGQMSLVQYDAAARRFVWQYSDPQTVLSYDGDCVVRPDVQSFSPSFAIAVDSSLYWLDGAPYISVQVGNNLRFLDLNTGELKSRQTWPMVGGFRTWVARVRSVDGEFVPLIAVVLSEI